MPRRRAAVTEDMTPDQLRALVNAEFGPNTMRLASDPALEVEWLPTGVLAVDWAFRGFAKNRHSELYGPPSTGKTTLTYYWIAEIQRNGGKAGFIDVEDKFDAIWATKCGVDVGELELHIQSESQAGSGNAALDIMEMWIRSRLFDGVVLDSIAALIPKEELEVSLRARGGYHTEQAKLMSEALRKLTAANRPGGTACVYINQVRENIGGGAFVKKDVTSGGRALPHYAATRIEMIRTETLKKKVKLRDHAGNEPDRELPYGHRILMRVQKEQTGAAYEGDQTTLVFNADIGGFDRIEDLIYVGLQLGYVSGGGERKWFVVGYEDEKQSSRTAFVKWLRRNRAVSQDLEEMIYSGEENDNE